MTSTMKGDARLAVTGVVFVILGFGFLIGALSPSVPAPVRALLIGLSVCIVNGALFVAIGLDDLIGATK